MNKNWEWNCIKPYDSIWYLISDCYDAVSGVVANNIDGYDYDPSDELDVPLVFNCTKVISYLGTKYEINAKASKYYIWVSVAKEALNLGRNKYEMGNDDTSSASLIVEHVVRETMHIIENEFRPSYLFEELKEKHLSSLCEYRGSYNATWHIIRDCYDAVSGVVANNIDGYDYDPSDESNIPLTFNGTKVISYLGTKYEINAKASKYYIWVSVNKETTELSRNKYGFTWSIDLVDYITQTTLHIVEDSIERRKLCSTT
jgi:hypothetical protein